MNFGLFVAYSVFQYFLTSLLSSAHCLHINKDGGKKQVVSIFAQAPELAPAQIGFMNAWLPDADQALKTIMHVVSSVKLTLKLNEKIIKRVQ